MRKKQSYQMKYNPRCLLVLGLMLLFASPLFSDERKEAIELYVVLDKSLSMVEEIDSVKEYVEQELVDQLLIPGDSFTLICFYGKNELFYHSASVGSEDLTDIRESVTSIEADGRFTDIGSALDRLISSVESFSQKDRKQYLLLLTDGKQEAPPESPYYAPDGRFNHRLLEHTKEIARKGWKIHILSIGADTAASELAERLSASYSQVPEAADSQEISDSLKHFGISIDAELLNADIDLSEEQSVLLLRLSIPPHDEDLELPFSGIYYRPEGEEEILFAEADPLLLPASREKQVQSYRVILKQRAQVVEDTAMRGELQFSFSGDISFQPAVFPILLTMQTEQTQETAPPVAEEGGGISTSLLVFVLVTAAILLIVLFRFLFIALSKLRNDDDKQADNKLE